MGYPISGAYDIQYYQGVIMAEIAVMLVIFIVLQMIYYAKWGHEEEMAA
jgi:hypothetical protein